MKLHTNLLTPIIVAILLAGCNFNKNKILETTDEDIYAEEMAKAYKQIKELEKESVHLEKLLREANDKIAELEVQLQQQHVHEEAQIEMTEDDARNFVYEHIASNDPDNIARGYQYCVHRTDDVYVVEQFSPEPGTPDRAAMILKQYEINVDNGNISETEADGPGEKMNCLDGYEI